MRIIFLSLLTLFPAILFAQDLKKGPFVLGDELRFRSEILNEERVVNVSLPVYYDEDSLRNYPVIYVLDGSRDEDFIHIAGLVQFCSFSWINDIEESIVVGISNVDRKRDFTFPSTDPLDQEEFSTSGHSGTFIEFINKELKPLIDKEYRTGETNMLIGQSLGGLLAAEILYTQPGSFDRYVIVSPSLWWDQERMLQWELPSKLSAKVYIAVGAEGEVMERTAKQLAGKFKESYNEQIQFDYLPEKDHGDALHEACYKAFQWF